jgi:ABC-type lipoprotein release transport system permease subunit
LHLNLSIDLKDWWFVKSIAFCISALAAIIASRRCHYFLIIIRPLFEKRGGLMMTLIVG